MIQPTESHSLPSHGMSCRFDSLIAPIFANFPLFPQQMFLSGLLTMTSQLLSLSSAIVMLLPEWSFWRPEANMSFPSLKCPETPPPQLPGWKPSLWEEDPALLPPAHLLAEVLLSALSRNCLSHHTWAPLHRSFCHGQGPPPLLASHL